MVFGVDILKARRSKGHGAPKRFIGSRFVRRLNRVDVDVNGCEKVVGEIAAFLEPVSALVHRGASRAFQRA